VLTNCPLKHIGFIQPSHGYNLHTKVNKLKTCIYAIRLTACYNTVAVDQP